MALSEKSTFDEAQRDGNGSAAPVNTESNANGRSRSGTKELALMNISHKRDIAILQQFERFSHKNECSNYQDGNPLRVGSSRSG